MEFRNARPSDYEQLVSVVDAWWGGRDMATILPRQFLEHFNDTSFVAEQNGLIAGFLVGYQPPSHPYIGYVHFIGVHPEHRRHGIAGWLYKIFAGELKKRGARVISGITADINKLSQAAHRGMGFKFKDSDTVIDSIPVHLDYDGKGRHRVIFYKNMEDF